MLDIVNFFKKSKYVIVFILLEFVCFRIFFYYKTTQNTIFIEQFADISCSINNFFASLTDYFYLRSQNQKLNQENARLLNEFNNVYDKMSYAYRLQRDTINGENGEKLVKKYSILDAKVIQNITNLNNNYFQIDKGSKQGVKKDMGVVTHSGIAGIVVNTTDNFSTVLSILNKSFKVSAKVKNNKFIGYIEWDGKNIDEVVMKNFPFNSSVNVGDSVITSLYSDKFVPYSHIGVINEIITETSKNSYTLKIKLGTKFNELDYAYVIQNLFRDEIDKLNEANPYQN